MVFDNPVKLLLYYDENLLNQIYRLYPWQVEILKEFSKDKPIDDAIRMSVVAANGSGKSQFVLAPCAIWMAVAFGNCLSYITSSSASQLDTQTERFIDALADKMDTRSMETLGRKVWDNIKRKKRFLPNDSFIDLFATDEPKRAEGKHPLVPNGEFGIFVDEGKSIAEDIYGAIDRCTGFTRRLDISSAGGCHGHFYDINTRQELGWWTKKITYKDCPHIGVKEFEQQVKKHGIHDPLVRSIFFSEFTSVEDNVVMLRETIESCCNPKNKIPEFLFGEKRAGIDLAGGGDETVMSIWQGNIHLDQESNRFRDVSMGVREIIHWVEKHKIKHENVFIEYDGFNRGIVAMLDDKGYAFNKVLSGGRARDDKRYANRMTELWFKVKRYVEEGLIHIMPDMQLKAQLANRYYRRQSSTDRIILERKEEAKKKGHPSPDRADAMMLAWANCPTIEQFNDEFLVVKKNTHQKYGLQVLTSELEQKCDEWSYGDEEFFQHRTAGVSRRVNNSLSCVNEKYVTKEESLVDSNTLSDNNISDMFN